MPGDCAPGAVVREGRALIYIPNPSTALAPHGIEPAWLEVFYNPRMEYNRDVSVLALSFYRKSLAPVQEFYVAEPLTATGVRPVRYALEAGGGLSFVAGDISECAVSLARMNARLNGVEEAINVYRMDARELLYATRRILPKPPLVVDIDPFGSPAPFIEAGLSVLGNRGMLAVTATDLAVLEGAKHRAALRRYGALVKRVPESKEVGLRLLLAYIARIAASQDKAVHPLLAYYADHYYRVYVTVTRGAGRADRMLEDHVGWAYYCPSDDRTYISRDPPACTGHEKPLPLGPLWTSRMNDPAFAEALRLEAEERTYLQTVDRVRKLLEALRCESTLEEGNLHLTVEQAASHARRSMPPLSKLLSALKEAGYKACRSHYSPTSIRTSASYKEVLRLV